jgi:Ion channel
MLPPRIPGQSPSRWLRASVRRTDDYGIALILILMTIIVFATALGPVSQIASVALSGGTLLFVLHTSDAHGRIFQWVAALVAAAMVVSAWAISQGVTYETPTAGVIGLLLAVVAPLIILRRIIISPTITFRLVLGALSVYLLIGLAYAYLFPVLASIDGAPFFVQTSDPGAAEYLYFSFTTLATIGFGDFTAATNLGRMMAVSEGLVGQLFLVSAVALLVGNIGRALHQVGATDPRPDAPIGVEDIIPPER